MKLAIDKTVHRTKTDSGGPPGILLGLEEHVSHLWSLSEGPELKSACEYSSLPLLALHAHYDVHGLQSKTNDEVS
jgi:hypothetical protein